MDKFQCKGLRWSREEIRQMYETCRSEMCEQIGWMDALKWVLEGKEGKDDSVT